MSNYNPEGASTNFNMEISREDACTQTTSDLDVIKETLGQGRECLQ